MKFLQLSLGRGKVAQKLLTQTAREKEADVLLISEQSKWSEKSARYQDATSDPFKIFKTQILLLEESLREASGRFPFAGDFNSKSPVWGEARLDRRGILVGEMVARNDLILLNRGRDFTFRRGAGGR